MRTLRLVRATAQHIARGSGVLRLFIMVGTCHVLLGVSGAWTSSWLPAYARIRTSVVLLAAAGCRATTRMGYALRGRTPLPLVAEHHRNRRLLVAAVLRAASRRSSRGCFTHRHRASILRQYGRLRGVCGRRHASGCVDAWQSSPAAVLTPSRFARRQSGATVRQARGWPRAKSRFCVGSSRLLWWDGSIIMDHVPVVLARGRWTVAGYAGRARLISQWLTAMVWAYGDDGLRQITLRASPATGCASGRANDGSASWWFDRTLVGLPLSSAYPSSWRLLPQPSFSGALRLLLLGNDSHYLAPLSHNLRFFATGGGSLTQHYQTSPACWFWHGHRGVTISPANCLSSATGSL